ncbi:hypothetical protein DPMN_179673 [Dreissena polymorpha]|uniref:Uncharacterized protein n=1 Tax=Dreissena polymorpha TaxID=45954 RepID=A0A9D4IMD9_DREPO|nr:hypothetical protein DPMN_179673 [Dreissena polymorpha]
MRQIQIQQIQLEQHQEEYKREGKDQNWLLDHRQWYQRDLKRHLLDTRNTR